MNKPLLTDSQIQSLLDEGKPITERYKKWPETMRPRAENLVCSRFTRGESGHRFAIYLRQSTLDDHDFSIGLRWIRGPKDEIALVRCNGWHDQVHRNRIERGTADYLVPEKTCHIHVATERYLALKGPKKIGFATATQEFKCLQSALEYFVARFGFVSKATGESFRLSLLE